LIFLIVSVGFTAGMLAALKTHTMAGQHYTATCLARNHIQHAQTLAFSTVSQLAKTNEWVDARGNLVSYSGDGIYRRNTSVTNPPGMTDTVEVVVQVYFPRPFGKMSTVPAEVRTYISKAQ
jgi:hypothetical protein